VNPSFPTLDVFLKLTVGRSLSMCSRIHNVRASPLCCSYTPVPATISSQPPHRRVRSSQQFISSFNLDTKYHIRIAFFQFFSHLPTLSMLPSELLNPNRASLQVGREPTTLITLNLCKKLQKFDYVVEKRSYVRNML
jgi:hypothetical protein